METIMKSDIFFFVTTIAVAIFTLLGTVILLQIIRVLRDIKRAAAKLEAEVSEIGEHAETLYRRISESFLFNLIFGKRGRHGSGK